jgi:hypothetical protein
MTPIEIQADRYTYRARLVPALIVAAPLALGISIWIPTNSVGWKAVYALVMTFGLPALLPHLTRDLGRQAEPGLFREWGGAPTNRLLSHRLSRLDSLTLARHHATLHRLSPDLVFPTAKEEAADISSANKIYGSAVSLLREKTRDRAKYPLVFAENINYGFRRNLWATKAFALVFEIFGVFSCAGFAIRHSHEPDAIMAALIGGLICVFLFAFWIAVITRNWVRKAADAYAERLIGSLDNI